jgi:hypothetical protein
MCIAKAKAKARPAALPKALNQNACKMPARASQLAQALFIWRMRSAIHYFKKIIFADVSIFSKTGSA